MSQGSRELQKNHQNGLKESHRIPWNPKDPIKIPIMTQKNFIKSLKMPKDPWKIPNWTERNLWNKIPEDPLRITKMTWKNPKESFNNPKGSLNNPKESQRIPKNPKEWKTNQWIDLGERTFESRWMMKDPRTSHHNVPTRVNFKARLTSIQVN